MWQRSLEDAWNHGKCAIGNAFNHALKWAGQIDHAMGLGRRVFGELQPAIQNKAGGSGFYRVVMQGISGYEQGKNEILGHYNKVQAQLSHLRRATPEPDLPIRNAV